MTNGSYQTTDLERVADLAIEFQAQGFDPIAMKVTLVRHLRQLLQCEILITMVDDQVSRECNGEDDTVRTVQISPLRLRSVKMPAHEGGKCLQLIARREAGQAPFNQRDQAILHASHRLCDTRRMIQPSPPVQHPRFTGNDLPPRLQQVLQGLAQGLSEKQIALMLTMSRHTVHTYVKSLHRRYRVRSRGELLCRVFTTEGERLPLTDSS